MCLLHVLRFRNVWIRESREVVKFCVQTRFRHKTFQKWGKFIFFLFHCKFNVILTKTTIFARKHSQIKTNIFARKQIPSDIFIYYNNRSRLFCILKIILSYYLNHKIQCIQLTQTYILVIIRYKVLIIFIDPIYLYCRQYKVLH